ncbi:TIM barrel protein [Kutzneria viridogrisea]|uniref:Hydroxypyruvate isomerase n=1 Tax=Kutzneria viridogrisea TaxID=47990 RepID=A0ABR6BCG8_9PSEU|nr:hydroxypyruvate isomerase [Kutzneria viridogrisea]
MLDFDLNLSILFTELPLLERPEAAARLGFRAVEFWWPFATATPADAEVDRFVAAVSGAGLRLAALNFYAGDMAAGERGIVSAPGRCDELADSVSIAVGIADRLGCRTFNALYGNRIAGVDPSEQDETALLNLSAAAKSVAAIGGTIVLEPLSAAPDYPLRTAADALAVADRVGADNVRLLADLYHLTINGDDLDALATALTHRVGHVQIADAPGRNQPGSGVIDLRGHLEALHRNGYRGHVGVEYRPSGASADSFGWLDTFWRKP